MVVLIQPFSLFTAMISAQKIKNVTQGVRINN